MRNTIESIPRDRRGRSRHSAFVLFSLTLTAGALLSTIIFHGDLMMKEFRRNVDANAPLKAGVEKMAAEMRAAKPEQYAVLVAARQNQALERERGEVQGARYDAMTTQGFWAVGGSPAHEMSETQLARSIDGTAAHGNPSASQCEIMVHAAKLLQRASGLLRLGDIGGARVVLAVAHDNGSTHAAFMLAETYDPLVLSIWKAVGIRADSARARELYARAYVGGIAQGKERSDALTD